MPYSEDMAYEDFAMLYECTDKIGKHIWDMYAGYGITKIDE